LRDFPLKGNLFEATLWITEAFPIAATVLLPIILFPLSGGMVLSSKTAAFISGYLKIPDMVSKGIILNIFSIFLIAVMVYLILQFFLEIDLFTFPQILLS
jgi:di/tricarboxylate transporter